MFAQHILSITANSASCERFFSALGGVLNKYRNNFTVTNLINNVELALHVRDEQIQSKVARKQLKKRFETRSASALQEAARQQHNPSTQPSSSPPYTTDSESDIHNDYGNNSNVQPTRQPPNLQSFRGLINLEIERTVEDQDSDLSPEDFNIGPRLPFSHFTVSDLFDFDNPYWSSTFHNSAIRTFNEELEIYELLDCDAEGDDDELNIDETTTQALLG